MNDLPQVNSDAITMDVNFAKVIQSHLRANNNLNENELPKYNGIINSIPYKTNETKED